MLLHLQNKYRKFGTLENDRTVLYKTKSLDGVRASDSCLICDYARVINFRIIIIIIISLILALKLTLTPILTLFSCFMHFFEHRPMIFKLANNPYRISTHILLDIPAHAPQA